MEPLPPLTELRAIESASRELWKARGLPRPDGTLGPEFGAPIRPVLAGGAANESIAERLHRVVAIDVDGRAAAIRGRRVASAPRLAARLSDREGRAEVDRWDALGVWMVDHAADSPQATTATAGIVEELARSGVLVRGDGPVRHCSTCRIPRTPETIVYQEDHGASYLVRFPVRGAGGPSSLLVWTDSLWKLLGTVAVLVSPELPYTAARFRRRGLEETIIVAKPALDRVVQWLPSSTVEPLEERPGAAWAEVAYDHPLATEYPALSNLAPPGASVLASAEVGDSGTGIVPLVPAHGATDWAVARQLGLAPMPVIGPDGLPLPQLLHKYAGLPLDALEAFVLRDLTEGGYIFAQLKVRRGIPHCAACGTALQWIPTSFWALEPGRLSAELLATFTRMFPGESAPPVPEPIPWPAAAALSERTDSPTLLECRRCERLAPASPDGDCPCGGEREPIRRELLPAFVDAVDQWARMTPVPPGELLRMHVPTRRCQPAVLHHLIAMQGAGGRPGELRLIRVPRAALGEADGDATENEPVDAVRAAIVRALTEDGLLPESFASARRQEGRRLRRYWETASELVGRMAAAGFAPDLASLGSHLAELVVEDRALLSVFERMRLEVERAYDAGQFARALGLLHAFWEQEFVDGYLPLASVRLAADADPALRLSAFRTVAHVLCVWNALIGPVAPHLAERVDRSLRGTGRSLFERPVPPTVDAALVPALERAFRRWLRLRAAIGEARRRMGWPGAGRFEELVIQVHDESVADELRSRREALARFLPANAIEVASPNYPWAGRRLEASPVREEIHRVYPAQEARIVRLLRQMPARRLRDGLTSNSLRVALDGHPTPILPGMVEFQEAMPAGFFRIPWGPGEIFARLPPSAGAPEGVGPSDPLLRQFQRVVAGAIRRMPAEHRPIGAILVVAGPEFAERIRAHGDAVAGALGLGAVRAVDSAPRAPLRRIAHGGRGRGARWEAWALVGGGLGRGRTSRHRPRAVRRRIAPRSLPGSAEDSLLEYMSLATRDREEAIREASDRLDALVGRPVFGPSKVAFAWTTGLTSYDAIAQAPFEQLESIPGFGHHLAAELLRRRGEEPPPRPREARSERPPEPTPEPAGSETGETDAAQEAPPTPTPVVARPAPVSTQLPAPAAVADRAMGVREPPVAAVRPADVPRPPAPFDRPGVVPGPAPARVRPPRESDLADARVPALAAQAAPAGPAPSPEAPAPPEPLGVKLWFADPAGAWKEFVELTADGRRGLCLSREFPDRLRTLLGGRSIDIVWLSNVGRANSIRPSDAAGLSSRIDHALADQQVRAVYLDGAEYLVSVLGAERALELLTAADTRAKASSALFIVPVDPSLLAPAALEQLRTAFAAPEAPPG